MLKKAFFSKLNAAQKSTSIKKKISSVHLMFFHILMVDAGSGFHSRLAMPRSFVLLAAIEIRNHLTSRLIIPRYNISTVLFY
jgi:hypothetical protein